MAQKWVRGGEKVPPRPATIVDVRAFELHGTPYYALLLRVDGEDAAREARLSQDMVYASPQPGDRALVRMVLGVVDSVERDYGERL
jgi:hypothetical protein